MIAWVLKNIFRLVSAVLVVCMFLSYLAPYVHPKWSGWLAHFATAFPWLLMLNVAMLVFWALNRNRFAIYHAILLLLGWSHITAFIGLSRSSPSSKTALTVLSHNLGTYLHGKNFLPQWEKAASEYVIFLKNNGDPDILCLQEVPDVLRDLLIQKSGYNHHFFRKGCGNIVLSRYPIDAGLDIPFDHTGNCANWVSVQTTNGKVRLYNLHLQSNFISTQADHLIKDGKLEDRKFWQSTRQILSRISTNTAKRADQAMAVRQHLDKYDGAAILCGDLNDTPNSYVYRTISEKMTDAFQEKGRGLGYTFAGSLPFLRIDYVFASDQFAILDAGVIHQKISDHYATYAILELR